MLGKTTSCPSRFERHGVGGDFRRHRFALSPRAVKRARKDRAGNLLVAQARRRSLWLLESTGPGNAVTVLEPNVQPHFQFFQD